MTYFIGGGWSGQKVPNGELHKTAITDFSEQSRGLANDRKMYRKIKISFYGTIKSFYLIDGEKPIDNRDQIIDLWDEVETDVYAI